MTEPKRGYWFRQVRMGRFQVIHWKGWVAFLCSIPVAAIGMGLETWLKNLGSQALYIATMVPFGLLVLSCAAYVTTKIDPR